MSMIEHRRYGIRCDSCKAEFWGKERQMLSHLYYSGRTEMVGGQR